MKTKKIDAMGGGYQGSKSIESMIYERVERWRIVVFLSLLWFSVFLLTAISAIMIGPYPTQSKFQSGKSPDVGVDYATELLTHGTASSNLKNPASLPFRVNPDPLFIDVETQPLQAAVSSDLNLDPALPFRVNPDPLFIHVETQPLQAAVSSDLNLDPALASELNSDRRFIDVETEPLTVTSRIKIQPQPSSRTSVNSGNTRESIGNRRMLKVSKESCVKCCVQDTPTSAISVIVGWVMLVYIALAAICFVVMMVLSFTNAPRYRIVKDGDEERVQLKRDDLESATLFCGALPRVRDSGRPATMLDVHVDLVKEYLRELSGNEKFWRIKHAVEKTNIVLKAVGFPIIFAYVVVRITWPALVVTGLARPWPSEMESINRVRP